MSDRLDSSPHVPAAWVAPLAEHGYELVDELLSTCQVEGGREALADLLQCTVEDVRRVEEALFADLSIEAVDLAPREYPFGALLEDEVPAEDER